MDQNQRDVGPSDIGAGGVRQESDAQEIRHQRANGMGEGSTASTTEY